MAVKAQLNQRLTIREQEAVHAFITRLLALYPDRINKALLFSSKARGDSDLDSDIDILIVVNDDEWRFQHAISDVASDVSLEYSVLIGPRVVEKAHWGDIARARIGLHKNITREGIPLRLKPA